MSKLNECVKMTETLLACKDDYRPNGQTFACVIVTLAKDGDGGDAYLASAHKDSDLHNLVYDNCSSGGNPSAGCKTAEEAIDRLHERLVAAVKSVRATMYARLDKLSNASG